MCVCVCVRVWYVCVRVRVWWYVGVSLCPCGIVVFDCVVLCGSEVRWGVVMGGVVMWSCHTTRGIMCFGGDSELTY